MDNSALMYYVFHIVRSRIKLTFRAAELYMYSCTAVAKFGRNRSQPFPAVTSLTRRTSSMMTRARSLAHSAKAQALRDGGISPAHQTDEGAEGGGAEDGRPNDEFHPAAAVSMAFDATGAWPRRQVEFGQLSVVDDAVSVVDDVDNGELQTLSCLLSCLMAE